MGIQGTIHDFPMISATMPSRQGLKGEVGGKTINIGEDGATFVPSVSDDGIISWQNDKNFPNPDPVNIMGPKGEKGDRGERGLQGERGEQGIQGIQGEKGDKGDKGDRGEQGIQGVQGAKGEQGAQGAKGADGTPATHRWSGTTLYITSASGTTSADLKGDKGDRGDAGAQGAKGDKGATGPQGPQGPQGEKGDTGATGANGKDGYTPVRGKDYWTDADQSQMIADVIAALPVYDGEVVSV